MQPPAPDLQGAGYALDRERTAAQSRIQMGAGKGLPRQRQQSHRRRMARPWASPPAVCLQRALARMTRIFVLCVYDSRIYLYTIEYVQIVGTNMW